MPKFNPTQLLEKVVADNASDLHLSVGASPIIRVNTKLRSLGDIPALAIDDIEFFLSQILDKDQKDLFDVNKELDFSISLGNKSRFRVNAFYQKGYPSVALRVIPLEIPSIEDLRLPEVYRQVAELKQGLVLIVGPTGSGKSTTLAALIDKINQTRAEHIITIEDPIEYVFTNKMSLIEQREMYVDTHSWDVALRAILRQDPNVVMIGEMRDPETMQAALQISETGHLVLATMHTNSAAQTVERIISSFPETNQTEIRLQFSAVLEVIISQRLIPSIDGSVIPAVEVLLATDAVKNLVREGETHMLDNVIGTSAHAGMVTMEKSLAGLVAKNQIDIADALRYAPHPEELRRMVKLEGRP